ANAGRLVVVAKARPGLGTATWSVRRTHHRLPLAPWRERRLARPGPGSLRHHARLETLHRLVAAAARGNRHLDGRAFAAGTLSAPTQPQYSIPCRQTIPQAGWRNPTRTTAHRTRDLPRNRTALRGRRSARAKDRLLPRPTRKPAPGRKA